MANFLEDAIKAYNGLNNNNSDLQRGTKLAETYRDLAMDITKGYTNLPKSQDERISYEPKTVTADVIRDDIENNIDQKESSFIILRSRLIDIFTNDFELTKSVNMYINVIPFANILSDSRNYYTHYNDAKRNKCVVKDNLKYSVAILEYSVSSYILKELGFSLDYINKKQKYTLDYIISERMIEKILENKR